MLSRLYFTSIYSCLQERSTVYLWGRIFPGEQWDMPRLISDGRVGCDQWRRHRGISLRCLYTNIFHISITLVFHSIEAIMPVIHSMKPISISNYLGGRNFQFNPELRDVIKRLWCLYIIASSKLEQILSIPKRITTSSLRTGFMNIQLNFVQVIRHLEFDFYYPCIQSVWKPVINFEINSTTYTCDQEIAIKLTIAEACIIKSSFRPTFKEEMKHLKSQQYILNLSVRNLHI